MPITCSPRSDPVVHRVHGVGTVTSAAPTTTTAAARTSAVTEASPRSSGTSPTAAATTAKPVDRCRIRSRRASDSPRHIHGESSDGCRASATSSRGVRSNTVTSGLVGSTAGPPATASYRRLARRESEVSTTSSSTGTAAATATRVPGAHPSANPSTPAAAPHCCPRHCQASRSTATWVIETASTAVTLSASRRTSAWKRSRSGWWPAQNARFTRPSGSRTSQSACSAGPDVSRPQLIPSTSGPSRRRRRVAGRTNRTRSSPATCSTAVSPTSTSGGVPETPCTRSSVTSIAASS